MVTLEETRKTHQGAPTALAHSAPPPPTALATTAPHNPRLDAPHARPHNRGRGRGSSRGGRGRNSYSGGDFSNPRAQAWHMPPWGYWPSPWSIPPCPYPSATWSPPTAPRQSSPSPGIFGPCPTQAHVATHSPTDIASAMATMSLMPPDDNWYLDTGATSHMTSNGTQHGNTTNEM
ncbi:unnamed protein product [Cuscuta europaea]|uniref:Uncharacterized protein n=1 Tax=Cuscuta europaea TaxID=41803 RepID=A0A9P1E8K2_CUSEU|nr:unnamed protein product [Cuscuta europaea]